MTPPIYNPLDPLGSLSRILWFVNEVINNFVYTALAQPDFMLGGKPIMQWLFEEIWGFAGYTAFTVLIVIVGVTALGMTRMAKYTPQAFIMAVLLGGIGAPAIWMVTGQALSLSKTITNGLGSMSPPGSSLAANDAMPLSDLGAGGPQGILYQIDMVFLILQGLLVGLIVLAQLIVGSLLMAALALYPLGELGRLIGRVAVYAWLASFLVGLPVVALFRRLSMVITANSSNDVFGQGMARVGVYGTIIFAIVLVVGFVAFAYHRLTRSMGGNVRSTVNGDVTTHKQEHRPQPVPIERPIDTSNWNTSTSQPNSQQGTPVLSTGRDHVISNGLVVGAVGLVAPEIPPAVTIAVVNRLRHEEAEETHVIPRVNRPL